MQKVYISGALTNAPDPAAIKRFYESIGEVCQRAQLEPYIPHQHTDPLKNPGITPADIFRIDKARVSSADLLIAYVGLPSLGVGMELAYAESLGIPIILLYEKGSRVSRFARGIPTLVAEIVFQDQQDALAQLERVLSESLPPL